MEVCADVTDEEVRRAVGVPDLLVKQGVEMGCGDRPEHGVGGGRRGGWMLSRQG